MVDGYEGGLDNAVFADTVAIRTNTSRDADYYGSHLADAREPSETAWIGAARARGACPTVAHMEADKARGI